MKSGLAYSPIYSTFAFEDNKAVMKPDDTCANQNIKECTTTDTSSVYLPYT